MKNLLLIPVLVLCASCSALGGVLSETGEVITALGDPLATEAEQDEAVSSLLGTVNDAIGTDTTNAVAVTGLGMLALTFMQNRARRKRGEPVSTDKPA